MDEANRRAGVASAVTGLLLLRAAVASVATVAAVRWWRHRHDGEGTGFVDGVPVLLELVTVDGRPVAGFTAAAFSAMRAAAAQSGHRLEVVSGFRTLAEQTYLFDSYKSGKCNEGHIAAPPGYSSHQSGRALDLNSRAGGNLAWLEAHAGSFGFFRTVPGEPWHWEFWGDQPGGLD